MSQEPGSAAASLSCSPHLAPHPFLLPADLLPLAGELAEGFAQGDDGRSHPGHTQAADGLPQAGHQVSAPTPACRSGAGRRAESRGRATASSGVAPPSSSFGTGVLQGSVPPPATPTLAPSSPKASQGTPSPCVRSGGSAGAQRRLRKTSRGRARGAFSVAEWVFLLLPEPCPPLAGVRAGFTSHPATLQPLVPLCHRAPGRAEGWVLPGPAAAGRVPSPGREQDRPRQATACGRENPGARVSCGAPFIQGWHAGPLWGWPSPFCPLSSPPNTSEPSGRAPGSRSPPPAGGIARCRAEDAFPASPNVPATSLLSVPRVSPSCVCVPPPNPCLAALRNVNKSAGR